MFFKNNKTTKKANKPAAPSYRRPYVLPVLDETIERHVRWGTVDNTDDVLAIRRVLNNYGIAFNIESFTQGPTLTQYTLTLPRLEDYKKVMKLEGDFKVALNREGVRLSQSGAYINIELPCYVDTLRLGDVLLDEKFRNSNRLTVAIGRAIDGTNVLADIEDLKHVLVAGASGSGKSVFVQGMILSLLTKHTPDDIELYMIDPKMVEFSFYRPLVQCHVVTETFQAIELLKNLTVEMDNRYRVLADAGVRDIDGYNKLPNHKMKRIVLFIDELADLMETSKGQTESYIVRIAQKARACGIHLVIATQYPKASVVTGLIKANIPTKVCFAVTSPTASCVMLGKGGAEKLIGKGDMLYQTEKDINPTRLQGGYADEDDILRVVNVLLKNQG